MCSVLGGIIYDITTNDKRLLVNKILAYIWEKSHARGRDGRGFSIISDVENNNSVFRDATKQGIAPIIAPGINNLCRHAVIIGNLRAEPTTEYVAIKKLSDQQPYSLNNWQIVHNGTIANDKDLRTNELPTTIDSAAIAEQLNKTNNFVDTINSLKGSFAILASNRETPNAIFIASNYKPIWTINTEVGRFFASSRDYLPPEYAPEMFQPYSVAMLSKGQVLCNSIYAPETDKRALVVCSGGLDSVVAAAKAKKDGYRIELLHFQYGSRAQGPEIKAVEAVAKHFNCHATCMQIPIYNMSDSPLLDPDAKIAGGEEGAEFASEWVPARNIVMLSIATAVAEARGIGTIVLGNNLEEAGAYPDNEPEFIARYNDILPFAVGANKQMKVIQPVGNLMKHEIVALGHELKAPMHLTWSCYRAGEQHCGKCGPCYMRKKAHEMNDFIDSISYLE